MSYLGGEDCRYGPHINIFPNNILEFGIGIVGIAHYNKIFIKYNIYLFFIIVSL
jgi:hypothetical protein